MSTFNFGKNLQTFAAAKIFLALTPGIIQVFALGYDRSYDAVSDGIDNEEEIQKQNKVPIARMLWHSCWAMHFFVHGYTGIKAVRSGDKTLIKTFLIQSMYTDFVQIAGVIWAIKNGVMSKKTLQQYGVLFGIIGVGTIYAIKKL
eukprot:184546_1